jgi:hypothetical protein
MAPHFDCFFQVIAKAAGKTAPPMNRPITRKSQPRSIPIALDRMSFTIRKILRWNNGITDYQIQANAAITKPKTQIVMWDILISSAGVAAGLIYVL